MLTAAKYIEDKSTTGPFLSVSYIKSACTTDKVAKAEEPLKVSNSRKYRREFVVWSVA